MTLLETNADADATPHRPDGGLYQEQEPVAPDVARERRGSGDGRVRVFSFAPCLFLPAFQYSMPHADATPTGTTSRCGSTAGTREASRRTFNASCTSTRKRSSLGFRFWHGHLLSHRQTPHYYPRTFILLVCVVIYIAVARWLVGTLIGRM
jgi:hypothetical protein